MKIPTIEKNLSILTKVVGSQEFAFHDLIMPQINRLVIVHL
jgi:hypothetical protein